MDTQPRSHSASDQPRPACSETLHTPALSEDDYRALHADQLKQQEHKRLVRNNLNLTWNKGKFNIVENLLTSDFVYKTSFNDAIMSREQYLNYAKVFRKGMPDLELSIEEMMAEGDRVMSRVTFSGTVQKDFFGIPASDRVVAFEAISMWEIRFGKIASLDTLLDMSVIERQVQSDLPTIHKLAIDGDK